MLQSNLAELRYTIRHNSSAGFSRLQNSNAPLLFLSFGRIFRNKWVIFLWEFQLVFCCNNSMRWGWLGLRLSLVLLSNGTHIPEAALHWVGEGREKESAGLIARWYHKSMRTLWQSYYQRLRPFWSDWKRTGSGDEISSDAWWWGYEKKLAMQRWTLSTIFTLSVF